MPCEDAARALEGWQRPTAAASSPQRPASSSDGLRVPGKRASGSCVAGPSSTADVCCALTYSPKSRQPQRRSQDEPAVC